jgi:paraquat-inducible protein B
MEHLNGRTRPQFNSTLEGAQHTLRGADRALSSDSPLQQNLAVTLEQLQRTARSLRALTDYLGAHPEALIRGRQPDQAPPQQGTRP